MEQNLSLNSVVCRPATAADLDYIIHTWRETHRFALAARGIPNDIYYPAHRKVILRLLDRSKVAVASNPEAVNEHIFGFICYEPPSTLHYLAVKMVMWRFGIAKRLMAYSRLPKELTVTHWNDKCKFAAPEYTLTYNPYLLMDNDD